MSNKLIESFLEFEKHRNSKTQETNPFNDAHELDEATKFKTKRSAGNEAVIKGKKWGITNRGTTVGRGGSSPEEARSALLRDASRTGSGIGSVEATRLRALAQKQKSRTSSSSKVKPKQVTKSETPKLPDSGQTPATGYTGPVASTKPKNVAPSSDMSTADQNKSYAQAIYKSRLQQSPTVGRTTGSQGRPGRSSLDQPDTAMTKPQRLEIAKDQEQRAITRKAKADGTDELSAARSMQFSQQANQLARKDRSAVANFFTAPNKKEMSAAKSELSKMYSAGRGQENKAPLTLPKFDQIRADAVKRKQNQSAIDQEFAGRQNVKDKATAAAAQDIADRQTSIPQNSVTGAQTKTQQVQDMIRGNTTPEQSTRNLNLPRINAAPQPKPEQQTPKSDSSILNPSGQREIPILTGDAARKRMGMDTNTGYSPPVQSNLSQEVRNLGANVNGISDRVETLPSIRKIVAMAKPQIGPKPVDTTALSSIPQGQVPSSVQPSQQSDEQAKLAARIKSSNASQDADMETNTDNIYNRKTARAVARAAAKAAAEKRKKAQTDLQNFGRNF